MRSSRPLSALLTLFTLTLLAGCQAMSCHTQRVHCCPMPDGNPSTDTRSDRCAPLQTPRSERIEDCAPVPHLRATSQHDLKELLVDLRDDAGQLANRHTMLALGSALGASLLIRETLDDPVRNNTQRHPERWNATGQSLGLLGDVRVQVPVMLGIYGYSVVSEDAELSVFSKTLIRAYTATGLSTLTVKAIANTDRPSDAWNGGQFGFPSFHAASATCIAAVADEYYGPRVGVPAYALAGLVGWTRIDQRDHDLSDIVFGTALGYIIGKGVARLERNGPTNLRLRSLADADNGAHGIALEVAY